MCQQLRKLLDIARGGKYIYFVVLQCTGRDSPQAPFFLIWQNFKKIKKLDLVLAANDHELYLYLYSCTINMETTGKPLLAISGPLQCAT